MPPDKINAAKPYNRKYCKNNCDRFHYYSSFLFKIYPNDKNTSVPKVPNNNIKIEVSSDKIFAITNPPNCIYLKINSTFLFPALFFSIDFPPEAEELKLFNSPSAYISILFLLIPFDIKYSATELALFRDKDKLYWSVPTSSAYPCISK